MRLNNGTELAKRKLIPPEIKACLNLSRAYEKTEYINVKLASQAGPNEIPRNPIHNKTQPGQPHA